MSYVVDFEYCELPATPYAFNKDKFLAGDLEQLAIYKDSKKVIQDNKLTYEQISDTYMLRNYARFVPRGCVFIDFDNKDEAEIMKSVILKSGVRCMILETINGYHFLFRIPDFYKKQANHVTNWFGYTFDVKGVELTARKLNAAQIIRVCSMNREERASWDKTPLVSRSIDIEELDVLPYWLWGNEKSDDLHKKGRPGDSKYTITDTPFTQLMTMGEGGRHSHIVERCSHFALTNGFTEEEFKTLIRAINDNFLVKYGSHMTEDDMFGDLSKRWEDYIATMESSGWDYSEKTRTWKKVRRGRANSVVERDAAEQVFELYDFYGKDPNEIGVYTTLMYKEKDGGFDYSLNVTKIREYIRNMSDQNFKDPFFAEVERQLRQICAEHNKEIVRNPIYVIAKNKVMSCVQNEVYDFDWLSDKKPTDVVLPWSWRSEDWVERHERDLGGKISKFIRELSRNSIGVPDKSVEQWLYLIAGSAMIPGSKLEKIAILSGGGQNGKSVYTSLIRLCLGADMFNTSKLFDASPKEDFWGEDLNKGICCIVDDMTNPYNKDAFSYLKGIITGSDTAVINPKFKPKITIHSLPSIIACTNHDFELYDKTEGMKRRVVILPTEYKVPDRDKDIYLQRKLVLNLDTKKEIDDYAMKVTLDLNSNTINSVRIMDLTTKEKGVLDSLDHGSLCWFANKCRYTYLKWLSGDLIIEESAGMAEKREGTFSGGFDNEINEFLLWYVSEKATSAWLTDVRLEYISWHTSVYPGENLMSERQFSARISKGINYCKEKGYKVFMKKRKNDKRMSLNYLYIGEEEE